MSSQILNLNVNNFCTELSKIITRILNFKQKLEIDPIYEGTRKLCAKYIFLTIFSIFTLQRTNCVISTFALQYMIYAGSQSNVF